MCVCVYFAYVDDKVNTTVTTMTTTTTTTRICSCRYALDYCRLKAVW